MSGRRTIVYAGGFLLPAGNASAHRALENSKLFRSLGHEVVLVGQLAGDPSPRELEIDGFRCINIHAPGRGYPYYKNGAASVVAALEQVGVGAIRALVAYNYPAWPLAQLIGFTRRHGIVPVAECTEWYGWEGDRVRTNLRRLAETELRNRVLAQRAGNVICASSYGARFFRGANTVELPFVIDSAQPKWAAQPWPKTPGRRRFVYAGIPGQGLMKDYLHLALAALAALAGRAEFDFQIAGLTMDDVLGRFPGLASDIERLGDRVTFHGRLPHADALGLLRSADFSLFVRPDNRMSNFGFPTKVAEAFACGVPTITNPTSDIPRYVRDGETGILLAGADAASIAAGISRALTLSDEAVAEMKARCQADNPFAPDRFAAPLAAFMENLR